MRTIRRVGGMAVAGLLLSTFVGGPAGAQTKTTTPETYVGSAAGNALKLTIAGSGVSAGVSSAKLDSTLKAVAEGVGSLQLGSLPIGGTTKVTASVNGSGADSKPQACTASPVPAQLSSIISLGIGCGQALAEVNVNGPHALGSGTVADVDLSAQTVLAQLPISSLSPVLTPLLGTIDTINKTIDQLDTTNTLPDLKVDDTISDLLTRLQSVKTLDVRLGGSTSEVTTTGSVVTSKAVSQGGVISLLPVQLPLADGTITTKPLIEVIIGNATATAVYDRATGKSTPSFDPAILTIRINTPTTDALSGKVLGINFQDIKVGPDLNVVPAVAPLATKCADAPNEYCLLPGTPLETRIAIASGRTVTNADGSVGAIADAVKVHALKNIGATVPQLNGGLLLEIAHAEAGVGGVPANTITVAVPDLPRELPRTGGTPWLSLAGVAGLAAAFFGRRALVRSH